MNKKSVIKSVVVFGLLTVMLILAVSTFVDSRNSSVEAAENKEELVLLIHDIKVYSSDSEEPLRTIRESLTSEISIQSDKKYLEI